MSTAAYSQHHLTSCKLGCGEHAGKFHNARRILLSINDISPLGFGIYTCGNRSLWAHTLPSSPMMAAEVRWWPGEISYIKWSSMYACHDIAAELSYDWITLRIGGTNQPAHKSKHEHHLTFNHIKTSATKTWTKTHTARFFTQASRISKSTKKSFAHRRPPTRRTPEGT